MTYTREAGQRHDRKAQRGRASVAAFRDLILSGRYVILDTETTGLEKTSEIVQIAIVDARGHALIDTLVKPCHPIPRRVTAIHGIDDRAVQHAPTFPELTAHLHSLLDGRNVIVYNASFDRRMLHQSVTVANCKPIDWDTLAQWWCAMNAYAAHCGDFQWRKLSVAAGAFGIETRGAHDALADCRMTWRLVQAMARA